MMSNTGAGYSAFWLSGTQNGGLRLIMRMRFRKNMIMKDLTQTLVVTQTLVARAQSGGARRFE